MPLSFDNSIHALHSSSMITEIFQTYEGELILSGPKKLIWHKVPINTQKIQVLPKKDRKFPFSPMFYDKTKEIKHKQSQVIESLCKYCNGQAVLNEIEVLICECIQLAQECLTINYLEDVMKECLNTCITSTDILSGGFLSSNDKLCSCEELEFSTKICKLST